MIASQVARAPGARDVAFWFNMLGLALCAPLGLALLPGAEISTHDLLLLALAGAATGIAIRLANAALASGQLSVVGPLMSLEGAVAAALVIGFGGTVDGTALLGGLLAAAGGVAIGVAAARKGHLSGSALAVPAAVLGGVALWSFAQQSLTPLLAFAIVRVFSTLTLSPTVSSWRLPPRLRAMLVAAALDMCANLVYLVGARGGSLEVTAVLASQFGVLTALGGVLHWRESLSRAQVTALLVLGVGVAMIAGTSG